MLDYSHYFYEKELVGALFHDEGFVFSFVYEDGWMKSTKSLNKKGKLKVPRHRSQ